MAKKPTAEDKPTFEHALGQLEKLVDSMEQGNLSLEESLKTFEEGIKLTRQCQKSLDEAEQKVKILLENTPDAELEPFENEQ